MANKKYNHREKPDKLDGSQRVRFRHVEDIVEWCGRTFGLTVWGCGRYAMDILWRDPAYIGQSTQQRLAVHRHNSGMSHHSFLVEKSNLIFPVTCFLYCLHVH